MDQPEIHFPTRPIEHANFHFLVVRFHFVAWKNDCWPVIVMIWIDSHPNPCAVPTRCAHHDGYFRFFDCYVIFAKKKSGRGLGYDFEHRSS
jgi:hypothetical protein